MARLFKTITFAIICLFLLFKGLYSKNVHEYEYIIVGAGPAGLQLGYLLKSANREYVVLERANISGSFFEKYPRHDILISINKRHTGQTNKEFNFRHDWNSLISDDESLLMKYYSKKMFPPRETLLRYLNDYKEKLGINVMYNVDVSNIRDKQNGTMSIHMDDQHGNIYKCRYLIIATGLWVPNKPDFIGSEYVIGYEDISSDPEDYEGKSVLIIGNGNSGFEIADSIFGSTNVVHMMGRSRIKLSWQTHYVGDLRAINNGVLDTYQLKSLDGSLETDIKHLALKKLEDGRLKVYIPEEEDYDNFSIRKPYDIVISATGWRFDQSIFQKNTQMLWSPRGERKYPFIAYDYRLANFNNIYVAGTAAHSVDYRKSAGGFIHGFRYTARTLHRIMEYKHHNVKWPHKSGSMDQLIPILFKRINEASGTYQMFSNLCDVIILDKADNSFTYYEEYPVKLVQRLDQYTGCGSDVNDVIVMMFEYGANYSYPGADVFREDRASEEANDAHNSNFLHPVFYYYSKLPSKKQMLEKPVEQLLPTPDRLHHTVEDFLTEFDGYDTHILPFRRFLEYILDKDIRNEFAENCMYLALTNSNLPHGCEQYAGGRNILAGQSTIEKSIEELLSKHQIRT